MESKKIKREHFAALLNAVSELADKGNVEDFNQWLDINDTRISLQETFKKELKAFENIKKLTGYDKYAEKVTDLYLKKENNIKHSDEDIAILKDFNKKKDAFQESEVEIHFNYIPLEIFKNLPKEVMHIRSGLLPIVDLEKNKIKK
jgi:hypothetical protein